MAKDKSKKKGGVSDDFAKPSEAKAGGDGFNFEKDENLGKLFLITPLRVQTAKGFEGKESEVVVADIVELNEKKPERSVEHEEVFVWGGWTKGAIRGFIGDKRVLGRLGQDKSKGRGKNAAWVLEDAEPADVAVARAYLEALNDPFRSQKGEDDGAGKKAKKGDVDAKKKGGGKGKKK